MNTINRNKNKSFLLSSQVKKYLLEKGYSHLFNWSDFKYFKKQTNKAFNKAYEIANLFINENSSDSDFNDYVF